MIKASIIGGAGYTAGELIRLLMLHPDVEIASVVSSSHANKSVSEAHPDLAGWLEFNFTDSVHPNSDVVFLCSGHGNSKTILKKYEIPESAKLIDLSSDFRHKAEGNEFVYGLPELNRAYIKPAKKVANPGCFATCIQLALLPLASQSLIQEPVHISAITGSTGAGQKPSETTHFSWRSNNASVYKAFTHQHLKEIKESMGQLQAGFNEPIHFIPMRGAFTRGILSAVYLKSDISAKDANSIFSDYYFEHPFVDVADQELDIKQVVNTNRALINIKKEGNQLLMTSVIDNLLKGASGQAVQNMNLMFGLEETTGLFLKPSAF
ncbi:MAG: N-acetyl-gamma-glutamyl-phosphate reductase [Balneolaceae bacterium]|nr:N-acetyl-gamma-glutamyl-phosphate reductase [Balneolaceae bacterium]